MNAKFEVVVIREVYNEEEDLETRVEQTKFFPVGAYRQAYEYYKQKQAKFDKIYELDEAHIEENHFGDQEYNAYYNSFAMPKGGFTELNLSVIKAA